MSSSIVATCLEKENAKSKVKNLGLLTIDHSTLHYSPPHPFKLPTPPEHFNSITDVDLSLLKTLVVIA